MTKRFDPTDRQEQILTEALRQARALGYQNIQRAAIADALGVAHSLVNRYFKTMPDLKRQVMRAAVRTECLPVIAQGIALKDRHALKAPPALRERAIASLQS
jgi:AcrR family transcriptional regulator